MNTQPQPPLRKAADGAIAGNEDLVAIVLSLPSTQHRNETDTIAQGYNIEISVIEGRCRIVVNQTMGRDW